MKAVIMAPLNAILPIEELKEKVAVRLNAFHGKKRD
jgi:hypothetical protein